MLLGSDKTLNRRRTMARQNPGGFSPSDIPQIAAGEFWLPGVGVSGTNPVLWAGRNGTNTLTSPAQAPDASTGPGGNPDWTYVAANSDIFNVASPAGPLVATDGVYVACWFRFDSLDTTSRVIVQQSGSAGGRKWDILKTASNNVLRVEWSDDGTAVLRSDVALLEAERAGVVSILDKYLFLEVAIDPALSGLSNKTKLWLNMKPITFDTQSGSGGAALFNGGVLRYGNNNFENQDFNGRAGPLYIGKKSGGVLLPSDGQRWQLMHHLSPKARLQQVVLDGNSIMAGEDTSSPVTTGPVGQLRAALALLGYPARDVHDRGLSGQTTAEMDTAYATRVAPFYDAVFNRNAFIFFEVRNSTTHGATAAEIFASYASIAAKARATGYNWIVTCTAPPTDGDAVGQGVAGAANALIRAGWRTFADAFVDLELVPEFTPAGNVANPTYYSTGVHLTDAGSAILAARFQTALGL